MQDLWNINPVLEAVNLQIDRLDREAVYYFLTAECFSWLGQ